MKKLIATFLALTTVMGLAACGKQDTSDEPVPASALEILETVWGSYAEEDKFYVMGGSYDEDETKNNTVENGPGNFDVANEGITGTLLVPADQLANIDQAASMMHGMLANNFTCGVFHMAEGKDATAFAEAMKNVVSGNQWICGMPEQMLITVIGGEYVLVSFGINDVMTTWKEKVTTAYPNAKIIADGAL